MKTSHDSRILCVLLIALTICLPHSAATAQNGEPTLSDTERSDLLSLMHESESLYLGLLASATDEQWSWKPAPDRWSVGECAEHIMRSNQALLEAAKAALASDPNPEWAEQTKGKADLLLQVMPNRNPGGQGGATAPQEIRPTGELSRGEIVEQFRALYVELSHLIETTRDPLKEHTSEHPFPIFGTLSAYDWILYVPLHTVRHSRQMVEVMETEGYPSGES